MGKVKQEKIETIDMFGGGFGLDTLKKETMAKAHDKGTICPCCEQFVKVYYRTINSTMAHQLIYAYHTLADPAQWFHARTVVMGSASAGDFSKLEYWGLIQRQHHNAGDDGKKASGLWRITPKGIEFLKGRIAVPKYAVVYNAKVIGHEGEETTCRDALGTKFDYNELMGRTARS